MVKKKVDITEKFKRFRQKSPELFAKESFRVVDVGKPGGTKIIVACPKGKFDIEKKRCKVGLKIQSILKERSRR